MKKVLIESTEPKEEAIIDFIKQVKKSYKKLYGDVDTLNKDKVS